MKSKAIIILAIVTIFAMFFCATHVYAENKVLDSKIEGQLVEIKEHETKTIEDYQARYGSEAYGTVAYILNLVRIWSIPLCFLGIAIGAVHKSILGIRKLDTLEKGRGMVVMFVTILIICQVLPLAFTLVVKFGRG
ncbi:MAG: hypothetical protein J5881_00650 [Clostridia bacterium]|nr:hypothetical protein [Clostridia bacterium]